MPRFNYPALLIGFVVAIICAITAFHTLEFLSTSVTADGVVTHLPFGPYHPQVSFTTSSGEQIEFPAGGFVHQNLGDRVRVRYVPDKPFSSAKIDTVWSIWDFPIVLFAFAALWILVGVRNIPFKGWKNDQSAK
ncbi:DUF3592 domain-containing protein [Paraburkholderia sp. J67]|uniref:DUF3592 domain-containing protein n=1 Tax=Paraburkholderia sp. J67 TaxID=2805435 RepID=UPI002ABD56D2|nr:DUF3592 domain-containing protein [Paraburkholderia sp. J67]